MKTVTEQWWNCYDDGWADLIVPEAFAHPAKMARGLAYRIVKEGLQREWWRKGDVVVDPFGGIGTTGLVCAAHGMRAVLVELEQRFVDLAKQNFVLHEKDWATMGLPQPTIVQGDSRELRRHVAQAMAAISSPPWVDQMHKGGDTPALHGIGRSGREQRPAEADGKRYSSAEYGTTPGQLGAMKAGSVDAAISSPPYEGALQNGGGARLSEEFKKGSSQQFVTGDSYGTTPGQLGAMKAGNVGAAISSPPFESVEGTRDDAFRYRYKGKPVGTTGKHYGTTAGQVGVTTGDTYWGACAVIYRELYELLTPGGHFACVVKGYIKKGVYQDLPAQTLALLESIGFEPVLWVDAMLVAQEAQSSMLGDVAEKRKSRKSFFRRLAESKGSPAIDAEIVLVVQKPA